MKISKNILIIFILLLIIFSCKKESTELKEDSDYIFTAPYSTEKIPDDLVWLTNDKDPEFASPEAKKGGTFHFYIPSFPNTFRYVGPDSNNSFRKYIDENQMSLLGTHPNTENLIPSIATHWAFGKDKKTMYFKLNKDAKWSDGVKVTAQDFAYTIEFMRSKYIVAPWYNDFYTEYIDKVVVYDDYTLAVVATRPLPDLFLYLTITPTPRHFFKKLDETFVEKYNWKIIPNTGSYNITDFKKGKYVIFERNKEWWAKDLKYFKNRFNIVKVRFDVIKDQNIAWEYFKKGKIDISGLTHPSYWYDKSNIDIFKNGYVYKIWFFYDIRQNPWGMYLNEDKEIFKDKNVRYAFAYGMNFEKINSEILRNEYYRLEHDYVGYGKYSNNKIKARRFDIEKVEYYMKLSGWKRGDDGIWIKDNMRYSVEVTYANNPLDTERLTILKEEAKKAGIELKLDMLDDALHYKKIIEKKHDVAWWRWSTSFRPEYWQNYHSENAHKPQTNNISNTDDPELDKLIEKYRKSIDENERIYLSLKIQEKLYDICDFIPAFMIPYIRQAYWRWWRLPKIPGTKNSDDGLFEPFGESTGGLFWYDENLHKETLNAIKKGIKFDPVTIKDETYMMEILKRNK